MNDRVLITGATGLIGRPTTKVLAGLGYEVVVLSRTADTRGPYRTIQADILDPVSCREAVKQADSRYLVHLAWHNAPKDRWSAPENLDWAAATLRLVKEFAELGGERAVCAGSCAEYDWSYEVLSEATPLKPSSLYGKSKAATGTQLTQAAADLGISLAWARVFFCYGPGEPKGRLLGDLLAGLKLGKTVPCTDGLQRRDFLHTHDIGRALAMILGSDQTGAVNVASGIATPVRELIETVAGQMGRPDLVDLGAIKRADNDPACLVADVSRLVEIGFKPAFNITSGIADCVANLGVEP